MNALDLVKSPCFPLVLALFMQSFYLIGIVNALGIFYDDISTSLGASATEMGTAFGCLSGCALFPAPIFAFLYDRCACRRFVFVSGAVAATMGVLLISCATTSAELAIYGSITGLGHNIIFIYGTMVLHKLKGNMFNRLYSISTCGFSLGIVILPLISEPLLSAYGWRGGLLIIGAMKANLIPCILAVQIPSSEGATSLEDTGSASLERLESHGGGGASKTNLLGGDRKTTLDTIDDEGECDLAVVVTSGSKKDDQCWESCSLASNNRYALETRWCTRGKVHHKLEVMLDVIRKSDFYMDPWINFLLLASFMHGVVYNGWQSFLVPRAFQRGVTVYRTITITLTAALGNFCGRVLTAIFAHRLIAPIDMYILMSVLMVVGIVCDVLVPNFYMMLLTSMVTAMAVAALAILKFLAGRDRSSSENFSAVHAAVTISSGTGSLVGGFISGLVADKYSTFEATFKLLAVFGALNLIVSLPPRFIKKPRLTENREEKIID